MALHEAGGDSISCESFGLRYQTFCHGGEGFAARSEIARALEQKQAFDRPFFLPAVSCLPKPNQSRFTQSDSLSIAIFRSGKEAASPMSVRSSICSTVTTAR